MLSVVLNLFSLHVGHYRMLRLVLNPFSLHVGHYRMLSVVLNLFSLHVGQNSTTYFGSKPVFLACRMVLNLACRAL